MAHPEWILFNSDIPLPPTEHLSNELKEELENMERYRLTGDGWSWIDGLEIIELIAKTSSLLSPKEYYQLCDRYAIPY